MIYFFFFFFSSRRRHTRYWRDWSSDVCSSDLARSREKGASTLRVRKAVITAAGANQRALPLQTLIHDGVEKSVLGTLIEQALAANISDVCVIVWPGDEARYAQAAGSLAGAVRFVAQQKPRGYGHAIYCAREFVGDEPFLHIVGD